MGIYKVCSRTLEPERQYFWASPSSVFSLSTPDSRPFLTGKVRLIPEMPSFSILANPPNDFLIVSSAYFGPIRDNTSINLIDLLNTAIEVFPLSFNSIKNLLTCS